MITLPDLRTSLLELLRELQGSEVKLIIGGGFGIYLKTEHVRKMGARTLLREWPEARSTNDLDLFLRPELLVHGEKLKPPAAAIEKLGYEVIPEAAKYQFVKRGAGRGEAGAIKLDLLTGPESRFAGTRVKVDERRVRPNPSVGIHAHPVNEVPTLEEGLLKVSVEDPGGGQAGEVFLPHPYSFLLMKLFAFRDRLNDPNKDLGRYHALDLYSILATTTEPEWDEALGFKERFRAESAVSTAGQIVAQYFSALEGVGIIRLRESPYYRPELQLAGFMSALKELFPKP